MCRTYARNTVQFNYFVFSIISAASLRQIVLPARLPAKFENYHTLRAIRALTGLQPGQVTRAVRLPMPLVAHLNAMCSFCPHKRGNRTATTLRNLGTC